MATPNIIFNIRYRYTQYAQKRLSFEEQKNRINTKDAFEYYDRDEACDKSISTSETFDYYDYRMGSQGGFNEDGDIGAKGSQELADKYKPEVLYQCVCTFKKDFAIENNIIQKENMKKLIRKSMNPILKQMGFDSKNIVWAAFYHTNTTHPHCHISFYEKEQTNKLHRIPKSKIERVRSKIVSLLEINTSLYITKDQSLKELIDIVNECDLPKGLKNTLSDSVNNSIKKIKGLDTVIKKMIDLESKIPTEGSMKYNSKNIRPFHNDIREIIHVIYQLENVKPFYNEYVSVLEELRKNQEVLYGTGTEEYEYGGLVLKGNESGKDKQAHYYQKEMYKLETRLGNMILQNILNYRKDLQSYKEQPRKESVQITDKKTKQQEVDIDIETIPETVVRKDSEDKNTSKQRKVSTKRFGKRIMRSRCRNISYGTIQELSRSIQTAYYAELSEKQKIQQVIRSAQEKAEEIQY